MEKVLILDCGAPQILAIAECLHASGYQVAVLCFGKKNYGYYSKYADERYLCPDEHSKEYAPFVMNFLKGHHFDAIIPTSDVNAEFCSFYKSIIEKYSGILIPDRSIFVRGYDKNALMAFCEENNFPHPETIDLNGWDGVSEEAFKNFHFPGLIKPNLTSGGRGMTLVHNTDELKDFYPSIHNTYGECHLQRFIKPGGKQIKVQVMTDKNGVPVYSSVIWKQRYYPINGGSSCCNVTIDEPEVATMCGNVLQGIGWVGFADFDLIEDPNTGKLLIMEINPRIPACVRSAFKSGMDYATMIADVTTGKALREYTYSPGKTLRHLGFEVLWFLKSPMRFKCMPCWFKFFGKDIYYQDWIKGNFRAFLCGSWNNIQKQMNPNFRKEKSGVSL